MKLGGGFVKKSGKWGVFFCKKVDLSSTQGALCTVSVFSLHFTYLGCACTQRTPLPTGLAAHFLKIMHEMPNGKHRNAHC